MSWFRFYDDAVNDPKVQRLPPELFKFWVNILCVASKHQGVLPSVPDIAFSIRMAPERVEQRMVALRDAGLLDETETGTAPHNWNGRQYKSDVSNERVRRYRER